MADNDVQSYIFDGVTVLDLTTFVTGGFASMMFANQGAEVIKIERPGIGDDSRYSGPPFVPLDEYDGPGRSAAEEGESPYFWTVNYDKRSIELNLKTDRGLEILFDLIESADVVMENFRPGTAERLGIGYDDVRAVNKDVIYCSISAFGDSGPWSKRPGYDLLVQGMSGLMSVTGEPDGPPAKVGVPVTDLITAMWAAFGVTAALYRRSLTGEGERVELGMLDAALPWLTKQAGKSFIGENPGRMGSRDPVIAPYQSYPTADGEINVACGNQRLWEQLCEAIEIPRLIEDSRFASNGDRVEHMDELEEELSDVFKHKSTEHWLELLVEKHELPVGPVNSVGDALDNEQVNARNMISEIEHPAMGTIPVIEHPLNFEHAASGFDSGPPLLGEHTVTVLQELGYTDEQVASFTNEGVIPDYGGCGSPD